MLDFMQIQNLYDPLPRAWVHNDRYLRSYQADALRNIYEAVMMRYSGRYTVMFPRQSGKNETQAQLEAAVMAAYQHRGGNIIKIIPTEKNQGKISTERLESVLRGTVVFPRGTVPHTAAGFPRGTVPHTASRTRNRPAKKDEVLYGTTRVRCLSASPNSAIVGATAELMLEVDEAQMVAADKYDREAAPMAAANNAVQVFWGTAWDDQTLLSRETKLAHLEEEQDGRKHVFTTTAIEVGKEVPEYERFVREQVERMGREHPAIRTQFFCEEISDMTSMFTPDRIMKMKGDHAPLYGPEKDRCYVFLIDVAGSDEVRTKDKQAHGFSDRRDATVVTICEVSLPEDKAYDVRNFVWKVVSRRLYRNMPKDELEKQICGDIDLWNPAKIIIDHSGLGVMLTDILIGKYKSKVYPVDITASNKTKMAWDFLALVDTGRWIEHKGDEINILKSTFTPGVERWEVVKEPELLQQMFFRELRACRIEPTGNPSNVRWGVKDGTRDHATGRVLHDDLVMSAAMAVFENGSLPIDNYHPELWDEVYDEMERMSRQRDRRWSSWW